MGDPVAQETWTAHPSAGRTTTWWTDEELTALAMAADPDAPLDPEAVPIGCYLSQTPGLLPAWYMPPAVARGRRWWMPVIVVVILGFLVVDAFGLCATYGVLTIA